MENTASSKLKQSLGKLNKSSVKSELQEQMEAELERAEEEVKRLSRTILN